jgi:pilus assembly protein CpaF
VRSPCELVRNALRMRPDRIIVGEVRGGEALDMLQAMNTGHEGSLSTAHANSPRDTLSRLETMALMSDVDLPVSHVREQIASALDLVVHLTRLPDGRRGVSRISAVEGLRAGAVQIEDIFRWRRGAHSGLEATGTMPSVVRLLAERDERVDPRIFAPLADETAMSPASPPAARSVAPGDPEGFSGTAGLRTRRRRLSSGDLFSSAWPGTPRHLGAVLE